MHILPAVDIRGGQCVNLVQGDYGQETVYSDDPVAQAVRWQEAGAPLVHIVDLDGARDGELRVEEALREMRRAGVRFEVGGGIRDMKAVGLAIEAGAERVILGTAAHQNPDLVGQAAREYPGRIAVGIDAKAGRVALKGWIEVTETDAVEFAQQMEEAGATRIIYTDILSDGMMKGPNLEATRAVARSIGVRVTASGGVSSLEDIRAIRGLQSDGVDEVIVGRALYVGAFTLHEAIAVANGVL